MPLAIGDRFEVLVTEQHPYCRPVASLTGDDGVLIANYLAGYSYRVTPVNAACVDEMLAQGLIVMQTGEAVGAQAGPAAVAGQIDINPKEA